MTDPKNQFVDPFANQSSYTWIVNHHSMQPSGRRRTVTAVAPTLGVGSVRQQGHETPQQLVLEGTILHESQRSAFIQWWTLCRSGGLGSGQTVYFYEYSGEQYEVIITDYEETKVAVSWNNSDPTHIPYHIYTYTLSMDVITPLAGPWALAADPQ